MKIELNETNVKIICKLTFFFDEYRKVVLWLTTPNQNIGGFPPIYLMDENRGHKVLQFIETAFDEIEELDSSAYLNAAKRLGW